MASSNKTWLFVAIIVIVCIYEFVAIILTMQVQPQRFLM